MAKEPDSADQIFNNDVDLSESEEQAVEDNDEDNQSENDQSSAVAPLEATFTVQKKHDSSAELQPDNEAKCVRETEDNSEPSENESDEMESNEKKAESEDPSITTMICLTFNL